MVCHFRCVFSMQTCHMNFFVLFIWNLQCPSLHAGSFSSLFRLFLATDMASAVHVLHANSHSSPSSSLMLFMSFVVHAFLENSLSSQLELLRAFFIPPAVYVLHVCSVSSHFGFFLAIRMAFTVHVLHLTTHSSHFEVFPDIYMSFTTIVHQANSHSSNLQLFNTIHMPSAVTFFVQIRNQAISSSFLIFICHFQWCSSCRFSIKPFWALSCY